MRPRRRTAWRVGIALGVAMVVAGAVIGYLGYEKSAGPQGAVRGYFAALQAGDAPQALAWGDVPSGPRTLLTSDVLRAQQRIAPIRDVEIGSVTRGGSSATVAVTYTLDFPNADLSVHARIGLVDRGGDWRLRATALSTQLLVENAAARASVLGAAVPGGETLVFPGAAPVTFDSPYLEMDPSQAAIGFGAGPVVDIAVQISQAGRDAIRAAVGKALSACVDGRTDVSCPVPSSRYVPGTARGRIDAGSLEDLTITLGSGDDGVMQADGTVSFTGTYRKLSFANRMIAGHGTVALTVHAQAYAVSPLVIGWTAS